MTPALVDRIDGLAGVMLSETSRQAVATISKRRVLLNNGLLIVGDTVRPAIGDYRIVVREIPAGTYTILAVWEGQALGVWSDPSDGSEQAIVRPGGFDDLVPPQLRAELQPLTWTQRLEARRDLAWQIAGGGLLILFGLPAAAMSRFRS
jgi:hypothetical protein